MTGSSVFIYAVALCAALFGLQVRAAAAEPPPRLALVIGNSSYEGPALSPLKNPANDAARLKDSLEKSGFAVSFVLDADQRAMKRAITEFSAKLAEAGDGATGLFYYSGHGFQANGANYIAPIAAQLRDEVDAEFEAVSLDWILGKIGKHKGVKIVILDACRNTALSRSVRSGGQGLSLLKRTPSGTFISFATSPGSVATDGADLNSPYSAAVAEEILREGASIEEAFKQVRRRVVRETHGDQVPWDHSSLTADFKFSGPADTGSATPDANDSVADAGREAELEFWRDVKDSGARKKLEAYLNRYPEGVFAELAAMKLAALGPDAQSSGTVSQVEQLFAKLADRSILVSDPTLPHEFYNNARMREIQGDYLKARQDYMKYLAFRQPFVDPHYRFQKFLRVQEGRAGAREIYNGLALGNTDLVTRFASILLAERDERVEKLTQLTEEHPDFAPAFYELSKDYSQARLGQRGLADKKKEREYLDAFTKLVEQGKYLRYFMDQRAAADAIEDSKVRLASVSFLDKPSFENPIRLNAMRSNQGWMLTFSIMDQAKEIFVRLPGQEEKSTGFINGVVDPTTGSPLPNPALNLPRGVKPMTLSVSYTDKRNQRQGPYAIEFSPNTALVASIKDILERMPTSWLTFQKHAGKMQALFTMLVSYKCGLSEIRYGLDGGALEHTFPVPECNEKDPYAVSAKNGLASIYRALPSSAQAMNVQLTYKDGTKSEVQRFEIDP